MRLVNDDEVLKLEEGVSLLDNFQDLLPSENRLFPNCWNLLEHGAALKKGKLFIRWFFQLHCNHFKLETTNFPFLFEVSFLFGFPAGAASLYLIGIRWIVGSLSRIPTETSFSGISDDKAFSVSLSSKI